MMLNGRITEMADKHKFSDSDASDKQTMIASEINMSEARNNIRSSESLFSPSIFDMTKLSDRMQREGILQAGEMGFNSILTKHVGFELTELARAANIQIFQHIDAISDSIGTGSVALDSIANTKLDILKSTLLTSIKQGVTGFVCHYVMSFPASEWKIIIDDIHLGYQNILFVIFSPGLTAAQLDTFQSSGFNFSVSSSCWWDYKASWLNDESLRLTKIAPVISLTSAPNAEFPNSEVERRRALTLAATFGIGWVMEAGYETGDNFQLVSFIAELNISRNLTTVSQSRDPALVISSSGTKTALLAYGGNKLLAINSSITKPTKIRLNTYDSHLSTTGIIWTKPGQNDFINSSEEVLLLPAEAQFFEFKVTGPIFNAEITSPDCNSVRISIENISPKVNDGEYPVRRIIGETLVIEADLITDGHDKIAAEIIFKPITDPSWQSKPMKLIANDRWQGEIMLPRLGRYVYAIRAWKDQYATLVDEVIKKHKAGINVDLEIAEGLRFVKKVASENHNGVGKQLSSFLKKIAKVTLDEKRLGFLSESVRSLMQAGDIQAYATQTHNILVDAERRGAQFGNWYEVFPRSQSGKEGRHGTFRDVIEQLPRVAAMGFDVLYFPPIHPIGYTNRKGRNNSLLAGDDDPGSPYAIGNEHGGHDAIHPDLGTLDDFCALIAAAQKHKIEIALDFAIQCAPDHPWLKDHKEWFNWRLDGSIKYAENPPKKYEDIVNVDFYADGAQPSLWIALRDIIEYWITQGVKIFRVDNPHTKPLPFWEWMIKDVRARHPEVIFLAEAFTRPKLMYRLAKIGFSQSYTYFTWRNTKPELEEYLIELTTSAAKEFFRPHFFVNTPDINPEFLQNSGRSGFLIRAALAATLSGLWGVYNGFELCEATAIPGKEEYVDSEKYQIRVWDHKKPGNIVAEVTRLNWIRRTNSSLQTHLNIQFHTVFDEQVLFFSKTALDGNVVLVAISLDPFARHETTIELPLWLFGLPDDGSIIAEDLMRDYKFTWHGKYQPVILYPDQPFCIWRIEALEGE